MAAASVSSVPQLPSIQGGGTVVAAVDPVAAAVAQLQERLPPIRPPSPLKLQRARAAPYALHYPSLQPQSLHAALRGAPENTVDVEARIAARFRALQKEESEARSAIVALEQQRWTKSALGHFHEIAFLDDSVIYRESSIRDAILREEDRLFMVLFTEHDARCQRIRQRELLNVQLRMHMMALEQDETRKQISKEEDSAFAVVQHKELIYRPASLLEAQAFRRVRAAHPPHHGSPARGGRQSTRHQVATLGAAGGDDAPASASKLDSMRPVSMAPHRPINSARGEDRYAAHGRIMWDQHKERREHLSKVSKEVASLPAMESFLREEYEGEECSMRLSMERGFFLGKHEAIKREAARIAATTVDLRIQMEAHEIIAAAAVGLAVDYAAQEHAAAAAKEQAKQPAASDPTNAAMCVSAPTERSCESIPQPAPPCHAEVEAQPPAPRRSTSSQHLQQQAAANKQQLVDAACDRVRRHSERLNPSRPLTAIELLYAVDEAAAEATASQQAQALRATTILLEASRAPVALVGTTPDTYAPTRPAPVPVPMPHPYPLPSEESAKGSVDEGSSAADNRVSKVEVVPPPPSPPSPPPPPKRPLFPNIDLLCEVLIDDTESVDSATHKPWRSFLAAAQAIETVRHAPACPNIRRFYFGFEAAPLSEDFLVNVLWRLDKHHTDVCNALELMPTRWGDYDNQEELEQEEQLEWTLKEMLAREKLIREQVDEFIDIMHLAGVRSSS